MPIRFPIRTLAALAAITVSLTAAQPSLAQRAQRGSQLPNLSDVAADHVGMVHARVETVHRQAGNIARELQTQAVDLKEVTISALGVNAISLTGPAPLVRVGVTRITQLDRPTDARLVESTASVLRMYDISDLGDGALAYDIGQTLLAEAGDGRIIRSKVGQILTMLAPPTTHAEFERAMRSVRDLESAREAAGNADAANAAAASSQPGPMLVRLTWLVSGPNTDGSTVQPAMEAVVAELEAAGMINWQQYGQTMVMTQPGRDFLVQTAIEAGGRTWDFEFNGERASTRPEPVVAGGPPLEWLNVAINVRPRPDDETATVQHSGRPGDRIIGRAPNTAIQTALHIPAGQTIVLGLTPMFDQHSVFVIELIQPM